MAENLAWEKILDDKMVNRNKIYFKATIELIDIIHCKLKVRSIKVLR